MRFKAYALRCCKYFTIYTYLGIGVPASPDFDRFYIPIPLGMYFPAKPSTDREI